MLSLKIRSSIEEVEDMYHWVKKYLPSTMTSKQCTRVLLTMQELVTNAIIHGNEGIETKTVTITLEDKETSIVLSVEDQGRGLPALPHKKEAENMDYLEENGRGMKLVVLMSDEAVVDKNKITITFNK